MNTKQFLVTGVLLVVVLAGVGFVTLRLQHTATTIETHVEPTKTVPPKVTTVTYLCDADHTVVALFKEGTPIQSKPNMPPTPTGLVSVVLDNEPSVLLQQTISADGGRYANFDESLVFWSKGQGALILNHDKEKTFTHCLAVADDITGIVPQVYHDDTQSFLVRLPLGYAVTKKYTYTGFGPSKTIPGVKFSIPKSAATGTNLSSDSYVSIESQKLASDACTAGAFLDLKSTGAKAREVTYNGMTYSFASSTDAGAGNRYEEDVFVRAGLTSCTAIRYFIHSMAIENYDPGTIKAFDRANVLKYFDAIRDSLVIE